ncbi:uncharacterized protein BO80DRAFT_126891 [Aspergillus ibericus CBS 121593]|uniref:Uncharacterized protein n=1 Tax=Aspergillus ibericus CBS 121593 TaxID=1448316 RepID=A0A395GWT2_9EURO|nr:hypothetical protein BO80DRAFT_126891 [Aspergillus ibericus CBS 121593]RAK99554.1 hypothetical protein BO80DRAFT_126891 [Aspergillus ibericus CBS 121593]
MFIQSRISVTAVRGNVRDDFRNLIRHLLHPPWCSVPRNRCLCTLQALGAQGLSRMDKKHHRTPCSFPRRSPHASHRCLRTLSEATQPPLLVGPPTEWLHICTQRSPNNVRLTDNPRMRKATLEQSIRGPAN